VACGGAPFVMGVGGAFPTPVTNGAPPQATGGGYSAPVWGRFMKHVYYGMEDAVEEGETAPPDYFTEPLLDIPSEWPMVPGLTTREVDAKSGLLWSRWCSEENRYTELYIPGTEPTEVCDESTRFRRGRDLPGIGRRR